MACVETQRGSERPHGMAAVAMSTADSKIAPGSALAANHSAVAMSTADSKIAPGSAHAANHSAAADDGANDRIRRRDTMTRPNDGQDCCNDGQHHI